MDQLVINTKSGGGFVKLPDPDNPNPDKKTKDGTIQFDAKCPGNGEYVKIFVKESNSSELGTLNSAEKVYALDGMYVVGPLKYRFDGPTQKNYCYLDLFPDR